MTFVPSPTAAAYLQCVGFFILWEFLTRARLSAAPSPVLFQVWRMHRFEEAFHRTWTLSPRQRARMFKYWIQCVNLLLQILLRVLKLRPMTSPTKANRPLVRKKLSPARSQDRSLQSRTKQPPPRIFVRTCEIPWQLAYARAHLRNKRGYLYLSWRDGKKIRTYYLGKAPNS
jgi:hypothetical protein